MANVTVVGGYQLTHRFLVPKFSRDVILFSFLGGSILIAKILHSLLENKEADCPSWDALAKADYSSGRVETPQRFIRLAPFGLAPAAQKHFPSGSRVLRVQEHWECGNKAGQTPTVFSCPSAQARRDIYLFSGIHGPIPDELLPPEQPATSESVFYVSSPEFSALQRQIEQLRARASHAPLIGQVDLANLTSVAPILTETSYEKTIGDICRAKEGDKDLLDALVGPGRADHLVVRIGNAACLLVSALKRVSDDDPKWHVSLYYHPERCAPTTYPGLGGMLAYDILVASSIAYQFAVAESVDLFSKDEDLREGILCRALHDGALVAVQSTYHCFNHGFGFIKRDADLPGAVDVRPEKLFRDFVARGIRIKDGLPAPVNSPDSLWPSKPTEPVKVCLETALSPNKFWRVVTPEQDEQPPKVCLNLALDYLLHGPTAKKLAIVKVGELPLVDRHEVEDYLFLQRLLMDYHANAEWRRPLCLGVFGQPGAGKSFGVKQLVAEMSEGNQTFAREDITINLSQVRNLAELVETFHRIRDACLSTPIPLVFFDEFDSQFEDRAFGWLKYFLAPMQDGAFRHGGQGYHFGKAIFVFAGGVNHSFSEFNERSRNPEFCDAKGPDFISRLRGILNIRGINMPDTDADCEHIYMIRRAVMLRRKLENRLGELREKLIDPELARAFLTIPRYKHGVRSMEAIIDMSSFRPGATYTLSNLPPRDQLDMHVDARDFLRVAGVLPALAATGS